MIEIYSPSGRQIGSRSYIQYIAPKELVNPLRLDIAAKVGYAKFLDGGYKCCADSNPEALYDAHIEARTGGIEPNAVYKKRDVSDYKHYFRAIWEQIKCNGFDRTEPIQVCSKNGLIQNGAHRLAAALALDVPEVPVVYDSNASGRKWDVDWFLRAGFARNELRELAVTYMRICPRAFNVGVVWPSETLSFDDVLAEIRERSAVFFIDAVGFPMGVSEFVFDVYAHDKGVCVRESAGNIREKVDRLGKITRQVVGVVAFECAAFEQTIAVRDEIRSALERRHAGPAFDVLHVACSEAERDYLASIVFSPSTMESYATRPALSTNLEKRLDALSTWTTRNSIPLSDMAVVGGAVLDLFGYKECGDIDIILSYQVRRKIADDEARCLDAGIDLASYMYGRALGVGIRWSDDELIRYPDLHVLVRGVRFVNLSIVLDRKRYSIGKSKNRVDLQTVTERRLGVKLPVDDDRLRDTDVLRNKSYQELVALAEEDHQKGILHAAAQCYRTLMQRWPEDSVGWCGLGICALQRGDNREARYLLEQASERETGQIAKYHLAALENDTG